MLADFLSGFATMPTQTGDLFAGRLLVNRVPTLFGLERGQWGESGRCGGSRRSRRQRRAIRGRVPHVALALLLLLPLELHANVQDLLQANALQLRLLLLLLALAFRPPVSVLEAQLARTERARVREGDGRGLTLLVFVAPLVTRLLQVAQLVRRRLLNVVERVVDLAAPDHNVFFTLVFWPEMGNCY